MSNILPANGHHPSGNGASKSVDGFHSPAILSEERFAKSLWLERKRSERSHRPFILMLLDCTVAKRKDVCDKLFRILPVSTRGTDIRGWYKEGTIVGVIFTEIGAADGVSASRFLLTKTTQTLTETLGAEQIKEIEISFHVFPETWDHKGAGRSMDSVLYPDLKQNKDSKRVSRLLKRTIDVIGSLIGLILLSPLFFVIFILIKLTSKGPVFFRQQRIGQYGARFTFLKFRSMYSASDHTIHKEYTKTLISGSARLADRQTQRQPVYKLTADPRITPVGRLLRRTSLDELPQLFNVLRGEMSLVGPRPPIQYEVDYYDIWHKQRLLAVKPGLTGLWQVEGRSRVSFDEMVRLDLKYARTWSLWLDLKILLRTPQAVISGEGAY